MAPLPVASNAQRNGAPGLIVTMPRACQRVRNFVEERVAHIHKCSACNQISRETQHFRAQVAQSSTRTGVIVLDRPRLPRQSVSLHFARGQLTKEAPALRRCEYRRSRRADKRSFAVHDVVKMVGAATECGRRGCHGSSVAAPGAQFGRQVLITRGHTRPSHWNIQLVRLQSEQYKLRGEISTVGSRLRFFLMLMPSALGHQSEDVRWHMVIVRLVQPCFLWFGLGLGLDCGPPPSDKSGSIRRRAELVSVFVIDRTPVLFVCSSCKEKLSLAGFGFGFLFRFRLNSVQACAARAVWAQSMRACKGGWIGMVSHTRLSGSIPHQRGEGAAHLHLVIVVAAASACGGVAQQAL